NCHNHMPATITDKPVQVVTLIRTYLDHRGNGSDEDPHRIITQWCTQDGELVFEQSRPALVNLDHRGNGSDEDPHRIVTQWWTQDGELVFEQDPAASRALS